MHDYGGDMTPAPTEPRSMSVDEAMKELRQMIWSPPADPKKHTSAILEAVRRDGVLEGQRIVTDALIEAAYAAALDVSEPEGKPS